MFRFVIAALVAVMLSACVDQSASSAGSRHHGKPPEDPADYHGVPTDMTPPSMLDAPGSSAAPAAAASQ
ncbi:hypothetical protein [Burkholderia sp. Ac-20379]|uniref:hypothetical protein n=1 Tax=Burkholderia sp. Ac-20379 TaxID=2703900 RepID=UPI00197ECB2B|nr:hypothetical protein [Burkholderia sp. Ac-20379]MBN3725463.1 hypothetical protein [Burkholderia sp. Ac-20379]